MAGKYFTNEDIRKMMTEKVKDYLDQGWYFNFNYMRVSNGYEFAAVTDGKDTVVIYFQPDKMEKATGLNVEKFTGYNNEYQNIWLNQGKGEILETTQFLYKYETETYVIVNDYDEDKVREKKAMRRITNEDHDIDVPEKMYPAIVNLVKKQGFLGLKRIKTSDVVYAYYRQKTNIYYVRIKNQFIKIYRDTWKVSLL